MSYYVLVLDALSLTSLRLNQALNFIMGIAGTAFSTLPAFRSKSQGLHCGIHSLPTVAHTTHGKPDAKPHGKEMLPLFPTTDG